MPGSFSEIEEVIELSKEASKKGGIYTSHLRDEGLEVLASVKEAITISEKADIPVILTHHKVIGKPMWGKSNETLELVNSARKNGLNIMIDQYPYNASYTGISVLISGRMLGRMMSWFWYVPSFALLSMLVYILGFNLIIIN